MGRDEDWLKTRIEAYHEAALAYAAVKLGLPERLADGPLAADALAAELRLSAAAFASLLAGACRKSAFARSRPMGASL